MKLLTLKFQAFGPFVKEQTIDFTVLNDKGMFLINGPTGTGKTTIFDAITYALFGKGSGEDRDDGKSLRSDFAKDEDLTYVDLVFEASGQTYHIYRQTPRKRKKQKGEGYTEEAGKVDLYMPDGSVISKIKDVDNKIVNEILHMTRDQFKSVALLAQGEFTKLVTADSKSRAAILEHIFQKEIYNRFQEKVTAITKNAETEMNTVKASVNTLIEKLEGGEEITGYIEAKEDPANIPSFLNSVALKIDELKEQHEESKKQKEKDYKAFQEASNKLTALRTNNKQVNSYLDALQKLEDLQKQELEINNLKKDMEVQVELNALKPFFDQIDNANKNIKANEGVIEDASNKLADVEKNKKWLSENKEKYDAAKKRVDELIRIIPTLGQIIKDKEELLKDKKALDKEQKKYDDAVILNKKQETNFNSIKERFFASSSYNLAKELEEGKPCPVCGSTHHPNKAHNTAPVSEAEYKQAEEDMNQSNQELIELKSALDKVSASFKQKEDGLVKTLTTNGFENANKELLYSNKVEEEVKSLEQEQLGKKMIVFQYEKLEKQVIGLEPQYKTAIESATTAIKTAKEQIEKVDGEIKEKLDSNTHIKTKKQYEEKTASKSASLNVEKIKEKLETFNNERTSAQAIVKNTPQELISQGKVDEASLIEETNNKKAIFDNSLTAESTLDNKIKNLEKDVKSIKEKYDECKEVISKCTSLMELSKTANGFNRMKLSFKMYILADYFDKIIAQANHRLTKISNGRYRLVRSDDLRKGNAQQGLDLDVFDLETGKERPASSLSGGEKFVSALSLALGLSDIIETNHALIQVESVFIDEGFGTLDENYLDMAMKALESLKQDNKTVAIISHVEKLKTYIPDSLVVKKTDIGSTIAFETKV